MVDYGISRTCLVTNVFLIYFTGDNGVLYTCLVTEVYPSTYLVIKTSHDRHLMTFLVIKVVLL